MLVLWGGWIFFRFSLGLKYKIDFSYNNNMNGGEERQSRQTHTNQTKMDPACDFCGDLGCVYCDSDDGGNDYDLTQYNDDDCGACDGVGCQYCDN